MRDDYLFATYDLFGTLESKKQKLFEEIDGISADRLLNTSVDSWVEYFYQKYELASPTLDREQITVDQGEAQVDVSRDPLRLIWDRSQPFYLTGTEVRVFIPFQGEAELFRCRPSSYTLNPPIGRIQGTELVLHYTRLDHNAEAVKGEIDRDLAKIQQYLESIKHDTTTFNTSLPGLARERVEARRQKLFRDQSLVGGLGFAIRQRPGAPETYTAPEIKRKASPVSPPKGKAPSRPEPILAIEEYEHILRVISNMVAVMERSPKAFKGMKEEDLRQHFLVQLNGQYEGQATGETFNFEGKTDILIRAEGRNIFIAECKFWDGPASVINAVNQLLGYTSWRDTKTALLMFNRGKNLTTVVEKVREATKGHSNVLRELPYSSETGSRYVLRHKDDPHRELTLTVLIFEVPV